MLLLGNPDPSKAVTWDTNNHLTFAVPFQDMKPNIYLDPLLPRIVELATTSSDRQTKVAACESLHSLVLYMLGKSVTQPQGTKKSPMEKLWKRVFPTVLRLACDVEQGRTDLELAGFDFVHGHSENQQFSESEADAQGKVCLSSFSSH